MDSDDDLDLPPPKSVIILDDSDDDLPPPAALASKRPPPPKSAGYAVTSPNAQNNVTLLNSVSGSAVTLASGQKEGNHVDSQKLHPPTNAKTKVHPSKVYKEGYLFKQQPSWPYSNQKRYCVLKNCRLFYFDSQENMKEGKPQGVIDLSNARLVDPGSEAKLSSNFGIHIQGDQQTEGNNKKGRTYVFSVLHAHELGDWKAAIQAVVGSGGDDEEAHWFKKMVDGVY